MAGFRMHVSTSTLLGCGYAAAGHFVYGLPIDTSVVAGAMCGFSGMLPDIDSDYGVPLRETIAFTAAVAPMLLVGHFQRFGLSHDSMILAAVSLYLFVRFGIAHMIRKYTVHRGMFHSIPACMIFAGIAFLICGSCPIEIRCYKSGGVVLGFMSHLTLDEIYAIEWKGGRWRFKKSFGTAIKFWGDDAWANFTTYAKLAIVAMIILGEPTVMERLEVRHPQFADRYQHFQQRLDAIGALPPAQNALERARNAFGGALPTAPPPQNDAQPYQPYAPEQQQFAPTQPLPTEYELDTAQRPPNYYPQ